MTSFSAIEDMVGCISTRTSPPGELRDIVRNSLISGFERITYPVAAKWLLGEEPDSSAEDHLYDEKDLEKVLFTTEFENCNARLDFLTSIMSVNEIEIEKIAEETVGQMNNWLYCVLKKFRLTFGVILSAVRRNKYAPSLYKRLLSTYNLNKVSCKNYITYALNLNFSSITIH